MVAKRCIYIKIERGVVGIAQAIWLLDAHSLFFDWDWNFVVDMLQSSQWEGFNLFTRNFFLNLNCFFMSVWCLCKTKFTIGTRFCEVIHWLLPMQWFADISVHSIVTMVSSKKIFSLRLSYVIFCFLWICVYFQPLQFVFANKEQLSTPSLGAILGTTSLSIVFPFY
jgi:hypothetical protein